PDLDLIKQGEQGGGPARAVRKGPVGVGKGDGRSRIPSHPHMRGDIDIRGSCRAPSDRSTAMNRAVIVICDSLRADLITPADAPFLTELGQRSARFANHASVFPSTTRTSPA